MTENRVKLGRLGWVYESVIDLESGPSSFKLLLLPILVSQYDRWMSSVELKKWFFPHLACVNSSGERGQALVAVAGAVSR